MELPGPGSQALLLGLKIQLMVYSGDSHANYLVFFFSLFLSSACYQASDVIQHDTLIKKQKCLPRLCG